MYFTIGYIAVIIGALLVSFSPEGRRGERPRRFSWMIVLGVILTVLGLIALLGSTLIMAWRYMP